MTSGYYNTLSAVNNLILITCGVIFIVRTSNSNWDKWYLKLAKYLLILSMIGALGFVVNCIIWGFDGIAAYGMGSNTVKGFYNMAVRFIGQMLTPLLIANVILRIMNNSEFASNRLLKERM